MKNYFLFKNGCLSLAKAYKVDFAIFSFFLDFFFYEFSKIKYRKILKIKIIGSLG